jgi:lysozyme
MSTSRAGQELIASFEGAPRLKARLCEGGKWELSYGCTTWDDNRPVREGDTCTPDEALRLFAFHLREKEEIVERHVRVPLNQHQYDALVSLVYNIGEGDGPADGFEDSTVLRMINATGGPRWMDAADAFAKWVYATKLASQRKADEPIAWYTGPDGQAVPYKRALNGLLRRRHAEACMFMSRDWRQACGPGSPFIKLETEQFWNAERGRNEDRILIRTEFTQIWEIARHYPLPEAAPDPKPAVAAVTPPPALKPAAPPPVVVTPSAAKPQITPPENVAVDVSNWNIGKIKVENGAKIMETSDRAVAVGLKLGGIAVKTFVQHRVIPAWMGAITFEVITDPVMVAAITIGVVGVWTWGHSLVVAGRRKRAKHAETASTLSY